MNYIEVHDLSFVYEEHPVLQHVSMAVQDGEFVVLAGENGAAKSTYCGLFLGKLSRRTEQPEWPYVIPTAIL